tara:strand:+ start:524 stop:1456 length:933 start_codon:yes stop_codon:yes gene_type:complete
MRALVTGGAGFIGGHIARDLLKRGHEVVVVDNLRTGDKRNLKGIKNFFNLDVGNDNLSSIFKDNYDIIYHFAGQSSVEISYNDPLYDLDTNTRSTLKILKHASESNYKTHIIFASSMSVYGGEEPMPKNEDSPLSGKNFYAIGKKASESYLSAYSNRNLNVTSLRLFNIYGPGQNLKNLSQGMLSIYLAQAIEGDSITVKGSLERTRDFVHIFDVLRFLRKIERNPKLFNKQINICSGKEVKVREVLDHISVLLKKKFNIIKKPSTPGDIERMIGCTKQLENLTGLKTEINIKEGISSMINSLKSDNYFS